MTVLNDIYSLGPDKKYYQPKELKKRLKKFYSKESIQQS